MPRITQRIILDILIFLSILNGWWFIAVVLAIGGLWSFPYFVESLVAGIMYDSLFGYSASLGLSAYYGTIISILILVIVSLSKKVLRS